MGNGRSSQLTKNSDELLASIWDMNNWYAKDDAFVRACISELTYAHLQLVGATGLNWRVLRKERRRCEKIIIRVLEMLLKSCDNIFDRTSCNTTIKDWKRRDPPWVVSRDWKLGQQCGSTIWWCTSDLKVCEMKAELIADKMWKEIRGQYDLNDIEIMFQKNLLRDDDKVLDVVRTGGYVDVILLSGEPKTRREEMCVDASQLSTPVRIASRMLLQHVDILWKLVQLDTNKFNFGIPALSLELLQYSD
eukprot:727845_1